MFRAPAMLLPHESTVAHEQNVLDKDSCDFEQNPDDILKSLRNTTVFEVIVIG